MNFALVYSFSYRFYVGNRHISRLSMTSEVRRLPPVNISLSLWDQLVKVQHRENDGTQTDSEVSEEERALACQGLLQSLSQCCLLTVPMISVMPQVTSISMMDTLRPESGPRPSWLKLPYIRTYGCSDSSWQVYLTGSVRALPLQEPGLALQ